MSDTTYATCGDLSLAYQVVGEGPVDIVVVPSFVTHIDLFWTLPPAKVFLDRLSRFSRLIVFDKAGSGLSDPVPAWPTPQDRVKEVLAVMAAAESERAILFGLSEGGPAAILTAATRPDRVTALMLFGTAATSPFDGLDDLVDSTYDELLARVPATAQRLRVSESEMPKYQPSREQLERFQEFGQAVRDQWGEGYALRMLLPSLSRVQCAMAERLAASPGMARATLEGGLRFDVADALPSISVPTLVLHATDDLVPVQSGRYLADHIPDVTYVEVQGREHAPWISDPETCFDAIAEFVTGHRADVSPQRRLATVLFTDIVSSTEQAAVMGDQQWRGVLERFDEMSREEVTRVGGRLLKSMGDGHFSTFDGPGPALACARAVRERAASLGVQVRAGVHTGECEMLGDDLGGIGVNIGARIAEMAPPSEILVSRTVRDLVIGSDHEFREHGVHELKGVPGKWEILALSTERANPHWVRTEAAAGPVRGRRMDRLVTAMAKHTPGLLRTFGRLSQAASRTR